MISAPGPAPETTLSMPGSCHPGREPVRFFERLRGTAHHVVLFAGVHATAETGTCRGDPADAIVGAHSGRIETHLIVLHEFPEDLANKGEILLDPRGELHHRYGARNACSARWFVPTATSASAVNLPTPTRSDRTSPGYSSRAEGPIMKILVSPRRRRDHARKAQVEIFGPMTLPEYDSGDPGLCRRAWGGDRDLPFQHRRRGDQPPLRSARRGYQRDHQSCPDTRAAFRRLVAAIGNVGFPMIEVHISNPARRGTVSEVASTLPRHCATGFGIAGYALAQHQGSGQGPGLGERRGACRR